MVKKSFFFYLIGIPLAIGFVSIAFGPSGTPPSSKEAEGVPAPAAQTENPKKKAARDKQNLLTLATLKTIKSHAREPASIEWESVRANEDGSIICIELRARNGFGGMNIEQFEAIRGRLRQSDAVWNKHCVQPLEDVSFATAFLDRY